jgi:hypothetical protein
MEYRPYHPKRRSRTKDEEEEGRTRRRVTPIAPNPLGQFFGFHG